MFLHFKPEHIFRDLNKAYIGFLACKKEKLISTGSWGCGAFGGDMHEKFVQQICAAVLAGVQLDYSTFKRDPLDKQLILIFDLIKEKKPRVCDLVNICLEFEHNRSSNSFFDFLVRKLQSLK